MIMRTATHKEANIVVVHEGDHALVLTTFYGMVVTEASEEEDEAVADKQSSKVIFPKIG